MNKLKSIYDKLELKKDKIKVILFIEGAYLLMFGIHKFFIQDFGKTSMYSCSVIILLIGICIFLCVGNNDGTTEGMGLVGMLEFYPVDLGKLYILLMKEAVKLSSVHLIISMLIASEMKVGYKSYIVMALIVVVVLMYVMLCYRIGLEGNEEYSIGTTNAVCIMLSPFLAAAVGVIYFIVL